MKKIILFLFSLFFTQPLFAKNFTVTTFTDKDDGFCDEADETDLSKDCSLREAVKAANAETDSEDDTIQLAGDGTEAYEVTSGQLNLTAKNLTIQGLGPDFTIIDANPAGAGAANRILSVASNGDNLTLSGITFKNGKANPATGTSGGGAILLQSKDFLTIESCVFENNQATVGSGGAIDALYIDDAKVAIINSIFTKNTSDDYGGAIAMGNDTSLTITGSRFIENKNTATYTGDNDGGAIYIEKNGSITVSQSYFYGNQAPTAGAIYVVTGATTNVTSFTENVFEENRSTVSIGGALALVKRDGLSLEKNIFIKNSAQDLGGAIYLYSDDNLTLQNNVFSENKISGTSEGGGAIYIISGSGSISHNTFYGNDAGVLSGGAIYIASTTTTSISLKGNIFSDNIASLGSNCYGSISTNGYNFFDEYVDCTLTKVDSSAADDFLDVDALLSPVQTKEVNGLTFYYYDFQTGSPAADVVFSCPSEDVIGTTRTDPCDAGAFEAVVAGSDSSSSSDTSGDSTSDGGSSSTGESSGGDTTTGTETTSGGETTGGDSSSSSSGEASTTGDSSTTGEETTSGDSSSTGEGSGSTENGTTDGTTGGGESSTTGEEGSSSSSTSSDGSDSSGGSDTSDGGASDEGNPNPTPPPADGSAAEGSGGCSLRL